MEGAQKPIGQWPAKALQAGMYGTA